MQLLRNIKKFDAKASVVTIGNFDGVHLGHQALIQKLKQKGQKLCIPTCLITFEPQPNEFFNPHSSARLTRFREKFEILRNYELDYIICLRFDKRLSNLSAENFVKNILAQGLHAKYILVGDDFRFGYRRQGDIHLLKKLSQLYNFQIESMDTFSMHEERVGSTRIRLALAKANLELVEKLLGRSFTMSGRVAHGSKLGRKLGFPTANIHLNRKAVPIAGIFCVKIYGLQQQPLFGVANVGNRPAVGGGKTLLEVYIFDFNQNIYGRHIVVEFIYKLRDEENYTSLELLKQQIKTDVLRAKEFLICC